MEHQNLHFGNRPYACTQCDKKFAARSNLIQHRMVHKRPYQCSMCNKRFDKEDQLTKHMYAHPQTMMQCTLCKKNCNNENDLKKHLAKVHPTELQQNAAAAAAAAVATAAIKPQIAQNGSNGVLDMHLPPLASMVGIPSLAPLPPHHHHPPHHGNQNTERISPPAGASPDGHPQTPPGHTTPPARAPPLLNERGQRIDAICSQLVTSVSNPLPESPHTPPTTNNYNSVIIKKEYEQQYMEAAAAEQSPRAADYANAIYSSTHELPRASVAAMYTHVAPMMVEDAVSPKDDGPTPPLPGIHEMFSRRSTPKLEPPPLPPPPLSFASNAAAFAAMPPLLTSADTRMNLPNDLPLNLMSPPPNTTAATPFMSSSPMQQQQQQQQIQQIQLPVGHQQNRPTAQLPPITHVLKQTHDQAVQHSTPIPGFPCLDDVINYYVNQGAIFKCQHCNVVFFERGMFFLHSSLHSAANPWECSICNKVCGDRNEFTLHFINQQHN